MLSSSDANSDSEQEPLATGDWSQRMSRVQRGRWARWGALVGIAALVVALGIGLLARTGVGAPPAIQWAASHAAASAHWQTYHDPFGLFTVQMPPAWSAQTATTDMAMEIIIFDEPAQGKGSAHVIIAASSVDRQGVCRTPSLLHAFSGLTLYGVRQTGAVAMFVTDNASFQIDVTMPGVLAPSGFGPATPIPTSIPATWAASDQTEVNQMLVSFHPSDPKPLTC